MDLNKHQDSGILLFTGHSVEKVESLGKGGLNAPDRLAVKEALSKPFGKAACAKKLKSSEKSLKKGAAN